MERIVQAKSGKTYSVSDTYPQLTQDEGKRRQQEAIQSVVKLLREQQKARKGNG